MLPLILKKEEGDANEHNRSINVIVSSFFGIVVHRQQK